jgi:hypothetical protein
MGRAISARSVIDPTLRLALIFRSLADRPCAPLAGWRTTPSRIGRALRSLGCPSDSGPRGSCRHGPRAHKAAGSDRSCRTIWCGREGVSRKTTGATQKRISSSKSPAVRGGSMRFGGAGAGGAGGAAARARRFPTSSTGTGTPWWRNASTKPDSGDLEDRPGAGASLLPTALARGCGGPDSRPNSAPASSSVMLTPQIVAAYTVRLFARPSKGHLC